MFLVIEYGDGTGEAVKATLEGGVVSQGGLMIPGILIQSPKDRYFKSDYFEAAINKGDERSGKIKPDEAEIDDQGCPLFKSFTWKIVGNLTPRITKPAASIRAIQIFLVLIR